ncbi:MAG: 23S rRNA (pseudouridine(1915)-N(3))-methyltransferase RlmH [Candidatus Gracilibacteria bacterium]|nr:23S rRNA (pseudouridine(1915)-N(3))-methyltransferase RlmH [Candidatus Gracilibacteria bacterium]
MIRIVSFVDSFKHYEEPIKEFQKRLGKTIDFVKLKPSKRTSIQEILFEETIELKRYLEKTKGYKVLLYIDSKTMDTIEFSKFVLDVQMKYTDIIFVIGGAYGVDFEKIKDLIDFRISFSPMTFPHAQAIMMLYEQLYRVSCIKSGVKYHH